MSYAAEFTAIKTRFETEWIDPLDPPAPRTPVAWENEHFKAPAEPEPWVRVTVFGSTASRASVGGTSARYRHDGEVIVEVWFPANEGSAGARTLADAAAAVFRAWQAGTLTFWTPRVVRVGREGAWYRLNVIAPFKRDSVFAHQ